jgi:hypothetical protein
MARACKARAGNNWALGESGFQDVGSFMSASAFGAGGEDADTNDPIF